MHGVWDTEFGLQGPPPFLRFDARRKERLQAEAVWTPAFWSADLDRMGTIELVDSVP